MTAHTGEDESREQLIILTIDDEESIRDSFRFYLEDFGYRVMEAENGRVGLDVFERERPDLVLVDLRMPEMDGLAVLARVTEISPDTPIIVVSGTGVISDAVEALHLGAWDYLLKPVEDLSVLRHAVDRTLERARLRRENRAYQESLEGTITRRTSELRASEERFRALSENANDAIMRIDSEGRCLYANPAAGRQLGLPPEALSGRTCRDLGFPEGTADDCEAAISRVFESGKPSRMEFQLPAGLWVDWSLAPEFSSDGAVEAAVISSRDVTERKQAAEQLERLGMAIEQSSEVVIITDTEGRITYTNPAFERVTGHSRHDVLGENPRILKSGQHENQFYQGMWQTISAGNTWSGRLVNKKRDGALYTEETMISPLRSATGEIISYVAVKRDITEELRLESELRQALKMESIGRLAGGVAHDFNNLLSPILGYAEMLLLDFSPDDPRYEDLVEIQRAAEGARDLTRQLLAFSRKQVLEMKRVDLGRVVSGFEKILRRTIREDIELVIDLTSTGVVEADVSQIEQVLMNLAVNSQDAMPDGGKLTICTKDVVLDGSHRTEHTDLGPGAYVVLSLSDTGTGMDSETLRNAFEPFFTTKESGKGTGLGLATVHGIVKQHEGHVAVESSVGQGTTFRIHFPCSAGGERPGRAEEASGGAPGGTETILVVEDNEAVRNLVCGVLRRSGYAVLVADGGEACLRLVSDYDGAIDLLLTDVVMPHMDGKELFERLSGTIPDLTVIYMSGYTDTVIGRRGVLDEGVDFIQKPISLQTLTRKVREVLDR